MSFKYDVLGKVRFGFELEDILKLKGIEDINSFLNPTIKNTESELLFDNIEKARDVFVKHIEDKSIIDLLVDCDVDGFTSASNIYQYIKRINPNIEIRCFIHRGKIHGLSEFVDSMCEDDSKLIIVPDAGSGDSKECEKLIKKGKDVIILDHHSIDASDNPAIVVNNQLSNKVTDKAMTGVGITYKFTKLLDKYYGVNYADDYLDLVALGMIGDRADTLNLQTRYLILKGLEQIRNKVNRNKLISVLVDVQMYSMNNKITINGIGFYVCPLMNSMIRLGEYEDKCYMVEALCNSDKMLDRKVRGKGVVNMTIQEYVEWKENNPQEFEQINKECLESWVKEAIKHELDDVAFKSLTIDKKFFQVVTYRKILEALTRKDDFYRGLCDELVRMHKEYFDYKKDHKFK